MMHSIDIPDNHAAFIYRTDDDRNEALEILRAKRDEAAAIVLCACQTAAVRITAHGEGEDG